MSKAAKTTALLPVVTDMPTVTPVDPPANDFGSVLRSAMHRKGLSAADLSRAIQKEIPAFSPGNISHYLAGRSVPRIQVCNVLSQMLGVDLQEFTLAERKPPRAAAASDSDDAGKLPALRVSDAEDGQAFLQVNQAVPWSVAMQIMALLRGETD